MRESKLIIYPLDDVHYKFHGNGHEFTASIDAGNLPYQSDTAIASSLVVDRYLGSSCNGNNTANGQASIAVYNGLEVVAGARLEVKHINGCLNLLGLAVYMEWRRQGIADALFRVALRHANLEGYSTLTLTTTASAKNLYRAHSPIQDIGDVMLFDTRNVRPLNQHPVE